MAEIRFLRVNGSSFFKRKMIFLRRIPRLWRWLGWVIAQKNIWKHLVTVEQVEAQWLNLEWRTNANNKTTTG